MRVSYLFLIDKYCAKFDVLMSSESRCLVLNNNDDGKRYIRP